MRNATIYVNPREALTDHVNFVSQVCQFIVGAKRGTDGAASYHMEYRNGQPVYLTVYNSDGAVVLDDSISSLRQRLFEEKRELGWWNIPPGD